MRVEVGVANRGGERGRVALVTASMRLCVFLLRKSAPVRVTALGEDGDREAEGTD